MGMAGVKVLLRRAVFWLGAWACWLGLLTWLSSQSQPGPVIAVKNIDKVEHFLYFAAGGVLLGGVLGLWGRREELPVVRLGWNGIACLVVVIGALVGWLDEWHQRFVPGRVGLDLDDWIADTLGSLVGGVAAILLGVRWALALPILLYERSSARESLQASGVAVAGMRLRVGMLLLGWPLASTLLGVVGGIVFRTLLTALPEEITRSPLVLALLLVCQGLLIAALSFTTTVGQALSMRRLYLQQREQSHAVVAGGDAREAAAEEPHEAAHEESQAAGSIWVGWCVGLVLIGFPLVLWVGLTESLVDPQRVQVTAHRGYDRVAPENTRSAIQAAIEIGADFAEIDVQLTADGVAVLLHDRDLKRVTGDPRPIREVSFAELQTLDAGSWFGREFANERVPTLESILDLARGRIKLNIELKVDTGDLGVAREVARLISGGKCEGECIVTSFSQGALREIRRANPNIRTGLIVATALGDVTRFEGELLSLRADRLTDTVLRQAHRQGLELHLWGISREVEGCGSRDAHQRRTSLQWHRAHRHDAFTSRRFRTSADSVRGSTVASRPLPCPTRCGHGATAREYVDGRRCRRLPQYVMRGAIRRRRRRRYGRGCRGGTPPRCGGR